jgi:hypothetical protein
MRWDVIIPLAIAMLLSAWGWRGLNRIIRNDLAREIFMVVTIVPFAAVAFGLTLSVICGDWRVQ